LAREIRQGVVFWGLEEASVLVGAMGLQPVKDVTLIRHASVASTRRGEGIGGKLLNHLLQMTSGPILVGTWVAAEWAIRRPRSCWSAAAGPRKPELATGGTQALVGILDQANESVRWRLGKAARREVAVLRPSPHFSPETRARDRRNCLPPLFASA